MTLIHIQYCVSTTQGLVGGGTFEYVRAAYSNPENVRSRRIRTAYDVNPNVLFDDTS